MKGSITNEIIIWLAITVSAVITLYWLINNFTYLRPDLERVERDLLAIQSLENEACTAINYSVRYNPLTESGVFRQENDSICIKYSEIEKCKKILCEAQQGVVDAASITYLLVERSGAQGKIMLRGE